MAYTKNTWNNGDVISKSKLDNIENGIYNNAVTQVAVNNGVASFKNAAGTELFTLTLPTVPTPTNMIANGDFSAPDATTDGWSAIRPENSSIAVSGGKLVLTHTGTHNYNYGISYAVNTTADHIYYIRYKVTKTLTDDDGDAKILQIMLGTEIATCIRPLSQNDVVENVVAFKTSANETSLQITFGGNITTTAANESMLELSYIEMYDVTDLMPN